MIGRVAVVTGVAKLGGASVVNGERDGEVEEGAGRVEDIGTE